MWRRVNIYSTNLDALRNELPIRVWLELDTLIYNVLKSTTTMFFFLLFVHGSRVLLYIMNLLK